MLQKLSDNRWVARSRVKRFGAAGTITLVQIPRNALIEEIYARIVTAWGSTTVIEIGGTDNEASNTDANGFMTSPEVDPKVTGMKRMSGGVAPWSQGAYWKKGGTITCAITAGNATVGDFEIFVLYTQIF